MSTASIAAKESSSRRLRPSALSFSQRQLPLRASFVVDAVRRVGPEADRLLASHHGCDIAGTRRIAAEEAVVAE